VFKALLTEPELLTSTISSIAEIIDEGVFKITKQGMSLIAADRAMVAVVDFNIFSKAFESYELDKEQTIGLNIGNFLSVLKRARPSDKLTFILQEGKLQIIIKNSSTRRFYVPLLDLKEEEVPPIEQLEFSTKVELKPEVLESGIADAEIITDSVLFEASEGGFKMIAEGDINKSELELEKSSEALIGLETKGEVKARYPLDYLKKMIKAAKIADSITIKFGKDYPMMLTFEAIDKLSLKFILAPRVLESE
jgi:proliferating cell nuclear antigen